MSLHHSERFREALSRAHAGRPPYRPTSVPRMTLEAWLRYCQDKARGRPQTQRERAAEWLASVDWGGVFLVALLFVWAGVVVAFGMFTAYAIGKLL